MSEKLSLMRKFTRGGQITMHSLRMMGQASKYVFKIAFVLTIVSMIGLFFLQTDPHQRYLMKEHYLQSLKIAREADSYYHNITLNTANGGTTKMRAGDFVNDPRGLQNIEFCKQMAFRSLWMTLLGGLLLVVLIARFFVGKSNKMSETEVLRGMDKAESKELESAVKGSGDKWQLTLAGIPIPIKNETQHFLMAGTIGSGKSQAIMEMLDTLRRFGKKTVILDLDGTYTSRYYRPGKDILLNPLDERCPGWDVWHECEDSADFEAFAESLMPLHLSNSDPFWINSARTIFSVAAFMMRKQNPNTRKLLAVMLTQSLGKIQTLVKNTVAESLVAEEIEKTALSIKATLTTYCKSLLYLPTKPTSQVFSIQKWITDDNLQDSWLFIGANKKKLPALRPLLTAWMDIAIRSTLSLEEDLSRRIWLVCDEIASLQRLPTIGEGAAEGRKCGLSLVAGIQDINQLRMIYGRDAGEALLSHFNTKLCLRSNSTDTAHWVEKVMGSREILEIREGKTYGAHEMRDGVSLNQERRKESLVLDSEVMKLDDLEGFIKLPGNYPIAKVNVPLKSRRKIAPRLEGRLMQDVLLAQNDVMDQDVDVQSFPLEAVAQTMNQMSSENRVIHHPEQADKVQSEIIPASNNFESPRQAYVSPPYKPQSEAIPMAQTQYDEQGPVAQPARANEQSLFPPAGPKEIEMERTCHSLFHAIAAGKNILEGKVYDFELYAAQTHLRLRAWESMNQGLFSEALQAHIRLGKTTYKTKDKYLQQLHDDLPGGEIEMEVLAYVLEINIICHFPGKMPVPYPCRQNHPNSIHIVNKGGDYYNLLIFEGDVPTSGQVNEKVFATEHVPEMA